MFASAVVPEGNNAKTIMHFPAVLSTYSSIVETSGRPTSSASVRKLWIPTRCHFHRDDNARDSGVPPLLKQTLRSRVWKVAAFFGASIWATQLSVTDSNKLTNCQYWVLPFHRWQAHNKSKAQNPAWSSTKSKQVMMSPGVPPARKLKKKCFCHENVGRQHGHETLSRSAWDHQGSQIGIWVEPEQAIVRIESNPRSTINHTSFSENRLQDSKIH